MKVGVGGGWYCIMTQHRECNGHGMEICPLMPSPASHLPTHNNHRPSPLPIIIGETWQREGGYSFHIIGVFYIDPKALATTTRFVTGTMYNVSPVSVLLRTCLDLVHYCFLIEENCCDDIDKEALPVILAMTYINHVYISLNKTIANHNERVMK